MRMITKQVYVTDDDHEFPASEIGKLAAAMHERNEAIELATDHCSGFVMPELRALLGNIGDAQMLSIVCLDAISSAIVKEKFRRKIVRDIIDAEDVSGRSIRTTELELETQALALLPS